MNKNHKDKYKVNKNIFYMNEHINIKFWNLKLNDKQKCIKNESEK
jgi:hypothetical protein